MFFQVAAPLLDGCILAVLEQSDTYGYHLTQQLKKEIAVSESTLYPVLRRLQKEGYLTFYDRQFQGRNRRYYTITPAGRIFLEECRTDWSRFAHRISNLFAGGLNHE